MEGPRGGLWEHILLINSDFNLLQVLIFTIAAVILRISSNPLANVLQKQLTARGQAPLKVNFISYLLLCLICLIPAIRVPWQQFSPAFWWTVAAAGIIGALGNGFLVKALEKGDLSVLGPINAYKSVIGMLVGLILLKEIPNFWGILGVLLIIWGSYFVLDTTEDRFSLHLLKRTEIQFRIWALILTAIEAVLIKQIINLSDATVAFYCWCGFGALFSGCFYWLGNKAPDTIPASSASTWFSYVLLVGCIGIMQFTTNYAFAHMQVGYALSLFQLSTIISVLLGYRLFRETQIKKKLIGAAIMMLGSVLIILLKK